MDGPQSVRFRVLGPVSASRDGASLDLGSPQQRLALALLLARFGLPVSTDQLIDEIWGEAPPSTARKTLQVYVSHLRALLGEQCIETGMGAYRIAAGQLDARDFEDLCIRGRRAVGEEPRKGEQLLAEALGLWMGTPYAGFEETQALAPEIDRLEDLRASALEDRIAAELEAGGSSSLIGELESLAREYPWRERFRAQLMLALYRTGRQADALQVFRRTREELVEELGVEPGPELADLQRRILQQDPSLLPAMAAESPGPARAIRGYELRQEVARSATARVFRAFDRGSGELVGVKALAPAVASDPMFLARFEPSATLLARLQHPSILPLLDFWREPEGAYLVSPWMEAGSLRTAIAGGRPLAPERALDLIGQIGSALSYSHRAGVVHGSLKPENVLLSETGGAVLADFPILPGPRGRYAAPEVRGSQEASPASDVYALGLVIHELLTGSLPRAGLPSRLFLPELQRLVARATAADPRERHARVEDVLRELRAATGSDVVGPATDDGVQRAPVRNPYKGLRAFAEADADDFHGREEIVKLILAKTAQRRLVAVVGPSGSGKSSVVRAGLIPALRTSQLGHPALVTEMYPGAHPFEQLEDALRRVAVAWPVHGVRAELSADEHGLVRLGRRILPRHGELLLVVDQFEELFSLVRDRETRERFIDSLSTAALDETSRIRIVITLRADFFDRPLESPTFGKLLEEGVIPLSTLSRTDLARAIRQPAQRVGLELEDGLLPEIVADAADQPGALPLVQFCLSELVERSHARRLTLDGYRRTGGVGGAVGRRAEDLFNRQTPSAQDALQQAFLRLVRVHEEGAYTRRRVRLAELASLRVSQSALTAALHAFAAHRLIVFDRDPVTRGATVEVAHEALLGTWSRLQRWVEDRRHDLLLQHRLAAARAEWATSDADDAFLLSGRRLAQYAAWEATTGLLLTAEESDYLSRSRSAEAARDRRGRRVRNGIAAAIGGLVIAGVALGLTAIQAGRAASLEELLRLARAAQGAVQRDPEQAVLVALEAAEMSQSLDGQIADEVLEALHEGLVRMRVRATIPRGGPFAFDDRNQVLAIGDAAGDRPATLWDVASASLLSELPESQSIRAFAFAPSSGVLLGVDSEGSVHRWQEGSHASTIWSTPLQPSAGSWFLEVSRDGALLALGTDRGDSVVILDAATGERVTQLPVDSPTAARFSPDGTQIAISNVGTVAFRDTSTWQPIGQPWQLPEGTRVNDLDWSPGGDQLVLATEAAGTLIRSRADGALGAAFPGYFALTARFDARGERVLIGGTNGAAVVVDPVGRSTLANLAGHAGAVNGVVFTSDGGAITTGIGDTTRLWDLTPAGHHELRTLQAVRGGRSGNLDFSDDGSLLATQSQIGEARVWDTSTWTPVGPTISGLPTLAGQITISPDGTTVAVAQGETPAAVATIGDPRLRSVPTGTGVFDIRSGDLLTLLPGHAGHVVERAFTPDGQRLVTAGLDGVIAIYDTTTWKELDSVVSEHGAMNLVTFDPSGERLVVGNEDGTFTIWRIVAGGSLQVERTVNAHEPGFVFARMSPDGSRIATASEDGSARIWDANGNQERDLDGHTGPIWNLAWSPAGDRLVTVAIDGTVRIWDPVGGQLRMTLTAVSGVPASAEISPDLTMAVAAGGDGLVYLYTLDPDRLVSLARERVTRSLTPRECASFGIDSCGSG